MQTGRSRGFCFIYYEKLGDAKDARDHCCGMEIDGRRIRVAYSITERPHTPTPGVYMGRSTRYVLFWVKGSKNSCFPFVFSDIGEIVNVITTTTTTIIITIVVPQQCMDPEMEEVVVVSTLDEANIDVDAKCAVAVIPIPHVNKINPSNPSMIPVLFSIHIKTRLLFLSL